VDKYLKERLVGAAVLVAAAIILIPEMLSGPKDNGSAQTDSLGQNVSDANGLKTYTIDLGAPKGGPAQANRDKAEQLPAESPAIVETVPPPPEVPGGDASKQSTAAQKSSNSELAREHDQRLLEDFTAQENSPQPIAKPAEKPEKPVSTETLPTAAVDKVAHQSASAGRWSVQVASFSVRATSERIAAELKSKGYPAFVVSYGGASQTMYRVRVGPVADRAAADALLKKIKPLYPGANVAAP
jgi:DedD protein